MIPGSAIPALISGADAGGYSISRSLRFNSADSAYFSRTPASAGNRKIFTLSLWAKPSSLSGYNTLFSADGNRFVYRFGSASGNNIEIYYFDGVAYQLQLITSAVYRDPSAWYHLQLCCNTDATTTSDRVKLYVNGIQVTAFGTASYPSSGLLLPVNNTVIHYLGTNTAAYLSAYLADIHFIDGQALDPTSFGEFDDNGIWQPIAYTGTYGTNGFHLEFADNSSNTATTLGKDTSGNGNNWTPNNLSVVSSYSTVVSNIASAGTTWGNINNAFDGNTGTYADGTGNNGTVSTITFNKPLTGVTLLEYYWGGTSTYGYNTTNVGTGPSSSSPGYVTAYSGSAITINNLRAVSQPGDGVVRVYAIRVNGTVLTGYTEGNPAGNDSLVDVPVNGSEVDTGSGGQVRGNYCTFNPLNNPATSATLGNGNLEVTANTTLFQAVTGTVFASSGKWYAEFTQEVTGTDQVVGIAANTFVPDSSTNRYVGRTADSYAMYSDGRKINNNVFTSYGSSWTTGDVIGVALDLDNGKVWFSKNGTWQASGDPSAGTNAAFTGITGSYTFACSPYGSGRFVLNAGARSFAYTAPSGFKALCTANLPAPLVTKPSTVMDVKLYTGNGTSQTISGLGFSPDLVWTKSRSAFDRHNVFDILRSGLRLRTDGTEAEDSTTVALTSNGFSLGSQSENNSNGQSYVAWTWDAGSSTVTNTQGSITSQVRANASAGFSIITATQPVTANLGCTVGHGLGVAPSMYIVKDRDLSINWGVYHSGLSSPATQALQLSTTSAAFTATNYWKSTSPTSSVLSIGTSIVGEGNDFVVYAFAPVAGYANAFSFTGNGSSDGPMVWLGFRPRLILLKRTDSTSYWHMYDTARNTYNVADANLWANGSDAEISNSAYNFDLLSNGFKVRTSDAARNASGGTYVGFAWAESPFQYARAR